MNPWQLKQEYERGVNDGRSGREPWFSHEVGTDQYWVYLKGYKKGQALTGSRTVSGTSIGAVR